ncbi:MAG: D-serine ammonia-lyase [Xanthomonadaceae bacterium]|nr:D-serine ammonia-lyase [Xanthomonadaceae bacterium]
MNRQYSPDAPAPASAPGTILESVRAGRPVLWINPQRTPHGISDLTVSQQAISHADTEAAAARFVRFRPVLGFLFPELESTGGVIESDLLAVPALQTAMDLDPSFGRVLLKADHGLPVAGSIKARGGIHEVLEFAEAVARRHGLLDEQDYSMLAGTRSREIFSRYQIAVGSTGNLGLSIGVMASALGFRAVVHMSADAKAWKKERLRQRGVEVVEHLGDYEKAVAAGRRQAATDPDCHFVDDESSVSLFLGYSAAAIHLRDQLLQHQITVDEDHPLFVYLPCGVGGAPGGITFGLANLFGPHVHCFFAEPTQSPCFLLEMMAEGDSHPSVYDFGLTNATQADGLAVPRASAMAARVMRPALAGLFTVQDDTLFRDLYLAATAEHLRIEPSAAAGIGGPNWVCKTEHGQGYLTAHQLTHRMPQATHIVWSTGGLFMPDEAYQDFYQRGSAIAQALL